MKPTEIETVPVTGCECPSPGKCKRHRCRKSPHLWQLCQTREDYFQLWERGEGPGQSVRRAIRFGEIRGLGDLIAWAFQRLGIERPIKQLIRRLGFGTCGCQRRQAWLNRFWKFPNQTFPRV